MYCVRYRVRSSIIIVQCGCLVHIGLLHLYLLSSGSVLTCGLNDAHQLGQGSNPSTAPPTCLVPKAVSQVDAKF